MFWVYLWTIHKYLLGGPDAKKKKKKKKEIIMNILCGSPFRPPKLQAPFLAWKLQVNPIENHVNSIVTGNLTL